MAKIKPLYGLTEKQMEEVYRAMERYYCELDVEGAISNFGLEKYNFTEEEIETAINDTLDYASDGCCYMEWAKDALDLILDDRKLSKEEFK